MIRIFPRTITKSFDGRDHKKCAVVAADAAIVVGASLNILFFFTFIPLRFSFLYFVHRIIRCVLRAASHFMNQIKTQTHTHFVRYIHLLRFHFLGSFNVAAARLKWFSSFFFGRPVTAHTNPTKFASLICQSTTPTSLSRLFFSSIHFSRVSQMPMPIPIIAPMARNSICMGPWMAAEGRRAPNLLFASLHDSATK